MKGNRYGIEKAYTFSQTTEFKNCIDTYQYDNNIITYRCINYTVFGIVIRKKIYEKE